MKDWIDLFHVLDFVPVAILLTAVSLNAMKRLESCIKAYVLNSWFLSLLIFFVAVKEGDTHLYIAAFLTLATKGLLLPLFLRSIVRKMGTTHIVEPYISNTLSLTISGILIAIVYVSLGKGIFVTGFSSYVLKISIAVILMGLFIMITRKKAVTQVLGLLFMENGLFMAGFSLTSGMPIIVELGILFDLLMVVIILGIFMIQIKHKFSSADLDQLTTLKG
ncbi:MAG: NADH dehydrogenase subunit E [Candidatus Scalindua rubra]|uniref:NADH dehydrogenase subunit E n=1 Tax=Candidatus Scalindua rubra TaxID=1872076 RepID=A0A1E3XF43_9BACT|nr:MAG: NADH dehydrogenase subunit E [Candidatus Scalindua rubra]